LRWFQSLRRFSREAFPSQLKPLHLTICNEKLVKFLLLIEYIRIRP
jgi:hypothetical protein